VSASNDVPAQSAAAQPVTYPQFVAGVAPGGDVHDVRLPVRRRVTWVLSLVAGLGGWVVILLSIVLTVMYCIEMANADEMVRKYGIGGGLIWLFALLALFVINVLGGIFGLIELLRCNNVKEVRRALYVLLLNVLPWIILGVLYWVYMLD
jgi:putative sensor kinase